MQTTPRQLGYSFPAEWEAHEATWLTWPQNEATWTGPRLKAVQMVFLEFIRAVSQGEKVHLMVQDAAMQADVAEALDKIGTALSQVHFHQWPTNDAWIRDYGPAFLINRQAEAPKLLVNWTYNAWGGKYPPFEQDNQIPTRVAQCLGVPSFDGPAIMEGGSVEFNGQGTLLTTEGCLLHPNRNPQLKKPEIERILEEYYGVSQVLWLGEGIVGDDTDGHIDDITRFVSADTVLTVVEQNASDVNYAPLQANLERLQKMRLPNHQPLNVLTLPMPSPIYIEGERMPASYANFYIANAAVIVPVFKTSQDEAALKIVETCFPGRQIIGLDARDIIWGLGSFHCLSQQEPAI
ncbi:MAG: agmatine deiminase family protein [Microscillaceae bacterium]